MTPRFVAFVLVAWMILAWPGVVSAQLLRAGAVAGRVVDGQSGDPVRGASIGWGRRVLAFTDSAGGFAIPAGRTGDTLVVYRIGYDTLRTGAWTGGAPLELRLNPDTIVLQGLRVMSRRITGPGRLVGDDMIGDHFRAYGLRGGGNTLTVVENAFGYRRVPCPVPPEESTPPQYCSMIRGEAEAITLYLDGVRFPGGLDLLADFPLHLVYHIEGFDAGRVVVVYTNGFAETAARNAMAARPPPR
ncbi:MAG TPA: hypothetical protein VGB66_02085 [Longimicrobium sp.]|jgi:hypothetical protein